MSSILSKVSSAAALAASMLQLMVSSQRFKFAPGKHATFAGPRLPPSYYKITRQRQTNILANFRRWQLIIIIVKLISLFSDPKAFENLKNCLHHLLKYPRQVITNVLTKIEEFLTEDVRLRAQHRELSQKLKKACVKVLEYIDLTESLQSMADDDRIQSFFVEITNRQMTKRSTIKTGESFPGLSTL